MTFRALKLYQYEQFCKNDTSSQLNIDHIELLYYIYSVEVAASGDIYARNIASKQTLRSRLQLLERCQLIKRLQQINLGGNTNSTFFCCTKRGVAAIKKWPLQASIAKLYSIITSEVIYQDRESAINLAHLSTLGSLSDIDQGFAYTSEILKMFSFEKHSTIQKRLMYLRRKNLIAIKTEDQRRLGISSILEATNAGRKILRYMELKLIRSVTKV